MLKEKNSDSFLDSGTPVAIKLVSGEEIIATVVDGTPQDVRLKRPLSLVMMAGEMESQGMVAFAPWMLGLPDDAIVTIERSKILYMGKAREDAANQYQVAVGDGKPTAPKGASGNNVAARR